MNRNRIEIGAYEMKGTYGHIQYRRGEDPDRRVCGVPVKVLWPHQVQYRCSFILQIEGERAPGTWQATFRGARFELAERDDGSLRAEVAFSDGTAGSLYIGREMGFGRRPVLLAARSLPDGEGSYQSKTFSGEVRLAPLRGEMLHARVTVDEGDPDLTARSPSAA